MPSSGKFKVRVAKIIRETTCTIHIKLTVCIFDMEG